MIMLILTYSNIGIGFGLFSTDSSLLYNLVTTLIATIIFLIYLLTISDRIDKLIYSIIVGGALEIFMIE